MYNYNIMNYKLKYIKYKSKYIQLKNKFPTLLSLSGGDEEPSNIKLYWKNNLEQIEEFSIDLTDFDTSYTFGTLKETIRRELTKLDKQKYPLATLSPDDISIYILTLPNTYSKIKPKTNYENLPTEGNYIFEISNQYNKMSSSIPKIQTGFVNPVYNDSDPSQFLEWENGIYIGTKVNGIPTGSGIYYGPNEITYEGIFLNGILSNGTIRSLNYLYSGDISNYKMEGYGTYTNLISGEIYEGEFKNNSIKTGVLTDRNFVYTGDFKDFEPNGKGKGIYPEYFTEYDGEWENGIKSGKGILNTQNYRYIGNFSNNQLNGKGIKYLGNTITQCEYKNGIPDGECKICDEYGTMVYEMKNGLLEGKFIETDNKTGCVNEFTYVNNEKKGPFKTKCADGYEYTGTYINNKTVYGKAFEKIPLDDSFTTYSGDIKYNKKNGKGTYTNTNSGFIYRGDFFNNKAHGFGVEIYSNDKTAYIGYFQNENKVGKGIMYKDKKFYLQESDNQGVLISEEQIDPIDIEKIKQENKIFNTELQNKDIQTRSDQIQKKLDNLERTRQHQISRPNPSTIIERLSESYNTTPSDTNLDYNIHTQYDTDDDTDDIQFDKPISRQLF